MPDTLPLVNFSAGPISPTMAARVDHPAYQNGLSEASNYRSLPLGGVTRRPGSYRIADITTDVSSATPILVPFVDSEITDTMLLIWSTAGFVNVRPYFFSEGAAVTTGTKIQLAVTEVGTINPSTKYVRIDNKIYFASYKMQPFTVSWDGTADDDWSIAMTAYAAPTWDAKSFYVPGDVVTKTNVYRAINPDYANQTTAILDANINKDPATATDYWVQDDTLKVEPDWKVNYDVASDENYLPSCVAAHNSRLVYGGSVHEPSAMWGSATRQYTNFILGINTNQAWKHTLQAEDSGRIHWIVSADALIVGAGNTEFVISGSRYGITPTNIQVETRTAHTNTSAQPALMNEQVIFCQGDQQQLRAMAYHDVIARYYAAHFNVFSEQAFSGKVSQFALMRTPRTAVLALTVDKKIVYCHYDRLLQEVSFWPWSLSTNGYVALGVIPANSTLEDRVVVVSYNEEDDYTLELFNYFDSDLHTSSPISTRTTSYGMFLDNAVEATVEQDATGYFIDGLPFEDNSVVTPVIEGAPHTDCTVTAGEIRLDHGPVDAEAIVGFNFRSTMKTNDLGPIMKMKRINQIGMRFYNTVGAKVGPSESETEELIFREGGATYGDPIPLYTDDYIVDNVGGFDRNLFIWVEQDVPVPQTVLAIVPWIQGYE